MTLPSLRWALSTAPLLGIDMDARHARLLACARRRRAWRVERCASAAVPPGSLQGGRIELFDELASTLRQLVASVDAGRRIALALPHGFGRQEVLKVPQALRPWRWRRWVCEQAERLGGLPLQDLAFDVQVLGGQPLQVLLSVCPLELMDDWQGLAEAAGLEVVLLDDRARVMRLALSALGVQAAAAGGLALAQAEEDGCRLWWWAADGPPLVHDLAEAPPSAWPADGWLLGTDSACARWLPHLAQATGGHWPRLDPLAPLGWGPGLRPPEDPGDYLVALGLALRRWHA